MSTKGNINDNNQQQQVDNNQQQQADNNQHVYNNNNNQLYPSHQDYAAEVSRLDMDLVEAQAAYYTATTDQHRKERAAVVERMVSDDLDTHKEWKNQREKDGL